MDERDDSYRFGYNPINHFVLFVRHLFWNALFSKPVDKFFLYVELSQ